MLTSVLAGCTGDSEVIDDTAREDIQDITTSNTENQNNMAANISIISSSLEALSTDLSGLNNDLIVKETSLLSTISIAEARMSSLEAHNLFLQVTLAGMNDSNSVEARLLQDQILDSNAEIKKIHLGIDKKTKHIYKLIQIDSKGTKYTLTVQSFKTNLPLSKSLFTFDKQKYTTDGYYINKLD